MTQMMLGKAMHAYGLGIQSSRKCSIFNRMIVFGDVKQSVCFKSPQMYPPKQLQYI